jgi:hypothetical protein
MRIPLLLALAATVGLSGCNPSDGPTPAPSPQDVAVATLNYACPILSAVQTSLLPLTPTQRTAIALAAADCQEWQANPSQILSPTSVAQVVSQAIIILIDTGGIRSADVPEARAHIRAFKAAYPHRLD